MRNSGKKRDVNKNIFSDFLSAQTSRVACAAGEVTGVHTPSGTATVTRQKSWRKYKSHLQKKLLLWNVSRRSKNESEQKQGSWFKRAGQQRKWMCELTLGGKTAMKWNRRPCTSGMVSRCLRREPTRSVMNWKDLLITWASAGWVFVLFGFEVVGRTDGRATGRDKTKTCRLFVL